MQVKNMVTDMVERLADLRPEYALEPEPRGLVVRKLDASAVCGFVLYWNPEEHPDEVLVDRSGGDRIQNQYLGPENSGTWVRVDDPDHIETVLRDLLALPSQTP